MALMTSDCVRPAGDSYPEPRRLGPPAGAGPGLAAAEGRVPREGESGHSPCGKCGLCPNKNGPNHLGLWSNQSTNAEVQLSDAQKRGFDFVKMMRCAASQHGLSSNAMALITSDCVAVCIHDHQMALITSDCAPCSGLSSDSSLLANAPAKVSRARFDRFDSDGGGTLGVDEIQEMVRHSLS